MTQTFHRNPPSSSGAEAASPTSAGPALELSPQLLRLGDEAVAQILATFFGSIAREMASIRRAIEDGDAATLERAAHELRGSSGAVGATRMGEICRGLEELAESGTVAGASDGLRELEREHEIIRETYESTLIEPATGARPCT